MHQTSHFGAQPPLPVLHERASAARPFHKFISSGVSSSIQSRASTNSLSARACMLIPSPSRESALTMNMVAFREKEYPLVVLCHKCSCQRSRANNKIHLSTALDERQIFTDAASRTDQLPPGKDTDAPSHFRQRTRSSRTCTCILTARAFSADVLA